MKIRAATPADIPVLLEIGEAMFHESRFRSQKFNAEKTSRFIEHILQTPQTNCYFVAVKNSGEIAGFLAGHVLDYFFSDSLLAQDRFFYVCRQYRGSSAAVKLLIAFRRWAENRHVHDLCINMSVGIDMPRFNKLMTHMGFACCGSNFSLPLTQHPSYNHS